MPSFDVVSQVDWQEVRNAVDQANREIHNRYDFKGSDARVEQPEQSKLNLHADDDFKMDQAREVLYTRLAKRGIDLVCLKPGEVLPAAEGKVRQEIIVRSGVDVELARRIVKMTKDAKLKVQAAIQGDQVRVTGKSRDDLQRCIALLRGAELGLPLQYINLRD